MSVNKVLSNQETTLKILSQSVRYQSVRDQSVHSSSQPLPSQSVYKKIAAPIMTAWNTVLSKENKNWVNPFGNFTKPCFVCKYYGHSFQECPNIVPKYRGACVRCWISDHQSTRCRRTVRDPPFKDGFCPRADLLKILHELCK